MFVEDYDKMVLVGECHPADHLSDVHPFGDHPIALWQASLGKQYRGGSLA
jgi:hypothetical protein